MSACGSDSGNLPARQARWTWAEAAHTAGQNNRFRKPDNRLTARKIIQVARDRFSGRRTRTRPDGHGRLRTDFATFLLRNTEAWRHQPAWFAFAAL